MRRRILFALAWLCMAPAPGDIGGCGQPAEPLDAPAFYGSVRLTQCLRCSECSYPAEQCELACDGARYPQEFPEGCFPLVHDGTVCLRALADVSCSSASRLWQQPPEVPSECDFCPDRT